MERRLGATSNRALSIAATNHFVRLANGVACSCAGTHRAERRTLCADMDRRLPRRHVADRSGHKKGRDARWAALGKDRRLLEDRDGAAEARADDRCGRLGRRTTKARRQPRRGERLGGCRDRELAEAVEALDLLRLEQVRRVEPLHLATEVHLLAVEVQPLEAAHPRATGKEPRPECVGAAAERRHRAEAGHNNAHGVRAQRTSFPVRTVAARYASPGSPRAINCSLTASLS